MNRFKWTVSPPISFLYDGRPSKDFLPTWEHRETAVPSPGGRTAIHTFADPQSGLRVSAHVRTFDVSDATDWVLEFENTGQADTPVLSAILPLDTAWNVDPKENAHLHYAKGSQCQMDDFLPQTHIIGPWRNSRTLAPEGGRSSNGVLPFLNLHQKTGGAILAIGWSGQWQATFSRDGAALHVTAGMQKTNLRLHPGEKIRTPRMLIVNYGDADPQEGNNALRRLLIAHYLPRVAGELLTPPVAQCLQSHYYLTGDMQADLELKTLPKVASLGATAYWIDACWYGQGRDWWQEVGNWTINRKRYPDGLRPIANAAHERGMKFVLWFEPARVRRDGQVAQEHPDFVLRCPQDPDNTLLDFGNPKARQHILDVFSRLIEESGVDIYREDFNFNPLPYWQAADTPDRIGMTEIRYITGHYAFWDELLRRFPHLAIDNCASGGRRIDLETMSRSLPLWPSDFPDIGGLSHGYGLHVGDQCINAGLARWVVLLGGGVWNFTPYGTRSETIGGWTFGMHIAQSDYADNRDARAVTPKDQLAKGTLIHQPKFPTRLAKAAIAEWKSLREYFLGDFYLLLPLTAAYHDWCAYQFHRADLGSGFALFFRRHQSPFPTMQMKLRRIDPKARYRVTLARDYEPSRPRTVSGKDLAAMAIRIADQPGSLLLRYAKLEKAAGAPRSARNRARRRRGGADAKHLAP
jgi:alpha-galactosidase